MALHCMDGHLLVLKQLLGVIRQAAAGDCCITATDHGAYHDLAFLLAFTAEEEFGLQVFSDMAGNELNWLLLLDGCLVWPALGPTAQHEPDSIMTVSPGPT